jgi:hypothetical protein
MSNRLGHSSGKDFFSNQPMTFSERSDVFFERLIGLGWRSLIEK